MLAAHASTIVATDFFCVVGDPPLGDRDAQVRVTTRLGGLLREDSRAAA